LFAPGGGIGSRVEADIIRNEFGSYGALWVTEMENSLGWSTSTFSVKQDFEDVLVVDGIMSSSVLGFLNSGTPRLFSHFAISDNVIYRR